jgi:hypothetical protein
MARTLPDNIVVGSDWTGPVTQAKCEWELTFQGDTVTIYYRDVWTDGLWTTRMPSIAAALGFTTYALPFSATARQITPGVLCEVQLVYKLTVGIFTNPPPSTTSENATTVRESITKHPNFTALTGAGVPVDANSPWQQWWNPATKAFDPNYTMIPYAPATMPAYLTGLTEYDVGASTLIATDYFDSEPDDVEPTLGQIATPPGKDEDGQYLLISGGKNVSGNFWVRRLVYQYSDLPWPTQVYVAS